MCGRHRVELGKPLVASRSRSIWRPAGASFVSVRIRQAPPPFRALLRNRALVAYVAAFAGNTWEVFAVRVWFVAYLAWVLRLPDNHISLPPLALVSGVASFAGVPASTVMAEIAVRRGRRPVVIGICVVSVVTC